MKKYIKSGLLLALSLVLLAAPVFTGSEVFFPTIKAHAAENVAAVNTAYNGKSPYYVMVNRQMNTVTVYGVGDDGNYSVPVKAMVASCGRAGHATPTGTFSTPDSRYTWRLMVDGTYGQYASRIQGSILFHSICYTSASKNKMISSEYDALGGFASRGCVRLQTIDAKWIYDNCPTGTLVTIYDSPEAGALGKPQRAVDSVSSSPNKNWDPTDPDANNPWRLEVSWAVSGTGHGEVSGVGAYRYGESVTLTAFPDPGSVFECWYDENWNLLSDNPSYTFSVDREQRLTASFRSQASVNVHSSASGTCSESTFVDPGSQVTVLTAARAVEVGEPAAFLGWYDGDGNLLSKDAAYTFTVNESVELYAMYEGDSYGDIPSGAWYAAEAAAAKKAGITYGITPVLFGADQPFTRAMTVQMIARAAGADLSSPQQSSFVDVPVEEWFAAAVNWASQNGIVKGVSETEFAPNQVITRQDMLVMMGRYMAIVEENAQQSGSSDEETKPENSGGTPSEPDTGSPDEQTGSTEEQNPPADSGSENSPAAEGVPQQTGSDEEPTETGSNAEAMSDEGVIDDDPSESSIDPAPSVSEPSSEDPSQPSTEPAPADNPEPVSSEPPSEGTSDPVQTDYPVQLSYSDVGDIADYAVPWFVYAQEHGILKGYEDNTVRPLNVLSRAEGTVLIMRMIDSLGSLTTI